MPNPGATRLPQRWAPSRPSRQQRGPLTGLTGSTGPAPSTSLRGLKGSYTPPAHPVAPAHPYAYGVSAPGVRPPPPPQQRARAFGPQPQARPQEPFRGGQQQAARRSREVTQLVAKQLAQPSMVGLRGAVAPYHGPSIYATPASQQAVARALSSLTPALLPHLEASLRGAERRQVGAELQQPGVVAKMKVAFGPGKLARELENIRANSNIGRYPGGPPVRAEAKPGPTPPPQGLFRKLGALVPGSLAAKALPELESAIEHVPVIGHPEQTSGFIETHPILQTALFAAPGTSEAELARGVATAGRAASNRALLRTIGAAGLATGVGASPQRGDILSNAASDVIGLGEFPAIVGYKAYAAAVAAAKGNWKPAEQLGKGFTEGLKHGALGELLQGHPTGALHAAVRDPVYTALEALAGVGVAGRVSGALVRGAGAPGAPGLRGTLARVGTMRKLPVALTSDVGAAKAGRLIHEPALQPDLIRRVLSDVARSRTRGYITDPHTGEPVRYEGRPVLKPAGRAEERVLQQRRVNYEQQHTRDLELFSRHEAALAQHNAEARKLVGRLTPIRRLGPKELHLASDFARGAIASAKDGPTLKRELLKRAAAIRRTISDEPERYNTRAELKDAEAQAATYESYARNKRLLRRAPTIAVVGHGYALPLIQKDIEVEAANIGHTAPELERSRYREFALAHVPGAKITEHINPDEVAAHESSHTAARAADDAVKQAEVELRSAEHAHTGIVERQKVARLRHGETFEDRRMRINRERAEKGLPPEVFAERRVVPAGKRGPEERAPGSRPATEAEKAALEAHRQAIAAAQERLSQAKEDRAVAREEITPVPKPGLTLTVPDGRGGRRYLSNQEIRAVAHDMGRNPDTLAYVRHTRGGIGNSAFYKQPRVGARPSAPGFQSTGSLFERGLDLRGREAIHEELAHKYTLLERARGADRTIGDIGLKHPEYDALLQAEAEGLPLTRADRAILRSNGHLSGEEGLKLQRELREEGHDYRPVRAFQVKHSRELRERIANAQDAAQMESVAHELLRERLVTEPGNARDRNVVMVAGHMFQRHEALLKPAGELERLGQLMNVPFRFAVLPQPKWLTGDFLEPQLVRLPLHGGGVILPGAAMDTAAIWRAIKQGERSGDPEIKATARSIRADIRHSIGTVGTRGVVVHRTYESFPEEGWMRSALYRLHELRHGKIGPVKLPAVSQLLTLGAAGFKGIFALNSYVGELSKAQAWGKLMRRDIQEMTGSYSKSIYASKGAIEDWMKGMHGTPKQERFHQSINDMLGKYSGFGPRTKRLVSTIAPFLPWILAALRFVYWTFPTHHTVAFTATQKAAYGVLKEWEAEHKAANVPPGELQDAAIRPDGGLVNWIRYGPWGATSALTQGLRHPTSPGAASSAFQNLTNAIWPQGQTLEQTLGGLAFTGRPLQVPKTPQNPKGQADLGDIAVALGGQLGGIVLPGFSTAGRLLEGGRTPYATSNLVTELLRRAKGQGPLAKPGPARQSALNRALNPFFTTYLKKKAAGGAYVEAYRRAYGSKSGAQGAAVQDYLKAYRQAYGHK